MERILDIAKYLTKKYKDEKTFINQLCAESSYAHLHAFHNVIKYEKDPELKNLFTGIKKKNMKIHQ